MNSHKRGGILRWFAIIFVIALFIAGAIASQYYHQYIESITKYVTLDDDGYRVEITTFDETVGDILSRYEIKLGPGDEISPNPEEKLTKNTNITITRAMPVTVKADGEQYKVHLTKGTVQDVLDKAGIKLREDDLINIPVDQQVKPLDQIVVTRMDEEILIEKESIPYEVITRKSDQLDEGVDRVVQEGRQGELERKIQVIYKDGVEIARNIVSEEVTVQPVNHIVEKGTVKFTYTSRGDKIRYKSAQKMVATAYTAGYESTGKNPGDKYYGITSSGKKVKPHHTIAAPSWIPFGTKVYIPELVEFWKKRGVIIDGIFTVEDRGGAITGNRIDIYMEDENMTRIWGKRTVTVYFIRD